jgi:hypothetical protein
MKGRLVVAACSSVAVALAGCGGGGSGVSSASLQPRLLPASSTPGFGLQRTLDWSDPVNLVGEGLFLPQAVHPSDAVKEFKDAHLKGAAGEVLTNGPPPNGVEVRVGVAQFSSAADANQVRDWMHREDLHQPCFSACIFAPGPVTVAGVPSLRFVVQSSRMTSPPPGVRIPRGVRLPPGANSAPANYLAEFTVGPYLYWVILQGDSTAKVRFEDGIKLYYAHAKQIA